MVRVRLRTFAQIGVSCLLLIYFCIYQAEWKKVYLAFESVDIGMYLLSVGVGIGGSILLAFKYSILVRKTSLDVPFARLIAINFISRFYGLFFPSGIGRDAIRWYKVTKNKEGRLFFLASTLAERVIFVLVLLFFGTVPLFLHFENLEVVSLRERLLPIILSAYTAMALVLCYFIIPSFQNRTKRLLKHIFDAYGDTSKLGRFLDNFSLRNSSFGVVASLFVLTIAWEVVFIGRMFFLFTSMSLPFGVLEVAWMGSLVLLLQVLPISFAGIGLREGAYGYLFSLYGLPSENGLVIGLLFFSQMLIYAIGGAVLNVIEQ